MMVTRPVPITRGVLACGLSVLLVSCAVGPDFNRPAAPQVDRYTHGDQLATTMLANGQAQEFVVGAQPGQAWWQAFGSRDINDMVARAMRGSPTVEAAEATLRQSEANLRAGYGVFFPQVGVGLDGTREHSAPILQGLAAPGSIFNVVTLTGSVAYALDLFGGQRRSVEGLRARSDYARYEAEAARLTLQANVVDAAIARAAYASQMHATAHLLDLQNMQVKQVEVQVDAGTTTFASLLAVRGLMAGTENQLSALRQRVDQAGHLLVNLQGDLPARLDLPKLDFATLSLPASVPLSLPSELVQRRPDILAAEASLHVASANIGVATVALFPSISLTGDAGAAGRNLAALSGKNSKFWSVGADASLPLFEGGTLWYGRSAAVAAYDAAAASYRQTVLNAFNEVADLLKALEHDAQAVKAQATLVDTSQVGYDLVMANYQAGVASYVDVLNAGMAVDQATIALTAASAQRYQDTVALYVAMGGGWQVDGADAPQRSTP